MSQVFSETLAVRSKPRHTFFYPLLSTPSSCISHVSERALSPPTFEHELDLVTQLQKTEDAKRKLEM